MQENTKTIAATEKDILDQAYARKSKKYQLSPYRDTTLHQNPIKMALYVGGRIVAFEEKSCTIMVYSKKLNH